MAGNRWPRSALRRLLGHREPILAGDPNFLVVGMASCGTSSLHGYLKDHPQVVVGAQKELGYFNEVLHAYPDDGWYRAQFVLPGGRDPASVRAIGEFTPTYCFSPCVERIASFAPRMRLVLIVRDPVQRAASQYLRYVRNGTDQRSAAEAIMAPEDDPQLGAYRWRGHYAEHLDLLHRHFPPEQIQVLRLEDLAEQPVFEMRRLTDFLGIDPPGRTDYPVYNRGEGAQIEDVLGEELIESLSKHFAPHNRRLAEQYGIRVDDWC